MLNTVKAIIRKKKIKLEEKIIIPEGTRLLVTILPNDESDFFWQNVSVSALDKIWNNNEDNIYAELLKK